MGNVNVALDGHQGAMAAVNDVHSEREQLHVQAVDAMHRGEPLAADELLTQIGAQYPTDRLAVRRDVRRATLRDPNIVSSKV